MCGWRQQLLLSLGLCRGAGFEAGRVVCGVQGLLALPCSRFWRDSCMGCSVAVVPCSLRMQAGCTCYNDTTCMFHTCYTITFERRRTVGAQLALCCVTYGCGAFMSRQYVQTELKWNPKEGVGAAGGLGICSSGGRQKRVQRFGGERAAAENSTHVQRAMQLVLASAGGV